MPVNNDRLNNLVREGAMLNAVLFSILADMPSGPLVLVTSRAASISQTSDSELRISSGQSELAGVSWRCGLVNETC